MATELDDGVAGFFHGVHKEDGSPLEWPGPHRRPLHDMLAGAGWLTRERDGIRVDWAALCPTNVALVVKANGCTFSANDCTFTEEGRCRDRGMGVWPLGPGIGQREKPAP